MRARTPYGPGDRHDGATGYRVGADEVNGGRGSSIVFTLGKGSGSGSDNPWNLPAGYSQQFLRLLAVFELRLMAATDSAVIVELSRYGHPRHGKWFLLSDNGGEIYIKEINSSQPADNVPFSGAVNPATLVHRVAAVVRGERVDWTFFLSDSDNAALLGSSRTRGGG